MEIHTIQIQIQPTPLVSEALSLQCGTNRRSSLDARRRSQLRLAQNYRKKRLSICNNLVKEEGFLRFILLLILSPNKLLFF
jgi:hypothetical protein